MKVLIKQEQIEKIIHNLATKIATAMFNGIEAFTLVPVMNGAAYLAVDLSRKLGDCDADHHFYSVLYSSYQGQEQGNPGKIYPEKLSIKTKNVILFDELYDTGDTLENIKKEILKQHPDANIKTAVAFFKSTTNTRSNPSPDFYGICTHDLWLVGCGLDDNGLNRYLRDLYAIPKTDHSINDEYHSDLFEKGEYMGVITSFNDL